MAILNPLVIPTSGVPQPITAPQKRRKRNMMDPNFYQDLKSADSVAVEHRQQPQEQFEQPPMSGEYIAQYLAKIQGRQAPPKLEPAAKVKMASTDVFSPGSFQQYYEQLGLIKQIGDEQLGAAQARSAYKRMQDLQNVMGQQVPGFNGPGGIPPTGQMPAPGNVNQTQAIVRDIAAKQFGWSGAEWDALYGLVQRESGWNPAAANPTSAARGLFQKMINMHGPIESTVEGQAMWGLNYIRQRYGSPSRALAHWMARVPINGKDVGHWY